LTTKLSGKTFVSSHAGISKCKSWTQVPKHFGIPHACARMPDNETTCDVVL